MIHPRLMVFIFGLVFGLLGAIYARVRGWKENPMNFDSDVVAVTMFTSGMFVFFSLYTLNPIIDVFLLIGLIPFLGSIMLPGMLIHWFWWYVISLIEIVVRKLWLKWKSIGNSI